MMIHSVYQCWHFQIWVALSNTVCSCFWIETLKGKKGGKKKETKRKEGGNDTPTLSRKRTTCDCAKGDKYLSLRYILCNRNENNQGRLVSENFTTSLPTDMVDMSKSTQQKNLISVLTENSGMSTCTSLQCVGLEVCLEKHQTNAHALASFLYM